MATGNPNSKPNYPKSYTKARAMQDVVLADVMNPGVKASVRAACVRAWDILEDRCRILRNRPLPGALRPVAKERKPRARAVEPSFVRSREATSQETTTVGEQETTSVGESTPGARGAGLARWREEQRAKKATASVDAGQLTPGDEPASAPRPPAGEPVAPVACDTPPPTADA